MKRLVITCLMLLQVWGCSSPHLSKQPQPEVAPKRETAPLSRVGGGLEIVGLTFGRPYFIWSNDGQWVVYQKETGIWAANPSGDEEEQWVSGAARRDLIGWWGTGLAYVEYADKEILLKVAFPDSQPRLVASIPDDRASELGYRIPSYALGSQYLLIVRDEHPAVRVHLASGEVRDLTALTVPTRNLVPQVSFDGTLVVLKQVIGVGTIFVIDLAAGQVQWYDADPYLDRVTWSPVANQWAALAVGEDRGRASHIVIGSQDGRLRTVSPPSPLRLRPELKWSPDGMKLVAQADVPGDETGRLVGVWTVSLIESSASWKLVGTIQDASVQGWHPISEHLVVGQPGPRWRVGLLPTGGGGVEWVLNPSTAEKYPLADSRLLVVGNTTESMMPRSDHGFPAVPVQVGYPTSNGLQVRGGYAAWFRFVSDTPGSPVLEVMPCVDHTDGGLPNVPAEAPCRKRSS